MEFNQVVDRAIDKTKAFFVGDDKDPVTLLKNQHREVEELFSQIEQSGERAYKSKEQLVQTLEEKLLLHAEIEERIFYPAARAADSKLVLESLEEHANVKNVLKRLKAIETNDETFDAKVIVLKEMVEHHVKEEENDLFPKCKRVLTEEQLESLAAKMQAFVEKKQASDAEKKPLGRPKRSNVRH